MITSPHNRRVASAVRLKKRAMRETDRRFLVEGSQTVGEALASGAPIREVFSLGEPDARIGPAVRAAEAAGIPIRAVSPEVMAHITSTVTPQGVVAVAAFVDVSIASVPHGASLVPVLVEVRDPGNAGTILRSADAAGADAVVFTASSVDVYNPKTVRATAGSLFHVPVVRGLTIEEAVDQLRHRGFAVLGATADADRSVYEVDFGQPTAVLFGNEAWGLSPLTASLCDGAARVPIRRAESLNLAAAATVFLFEAARQRAGGGSLARVVAGTAHDIRSPLAALKGFGSTLARRWESLTEEQRELMLSGIAHDAERMATIIAQLVDAARLESGRLELSLAPTDLLEVAGGLSDPEWDTEVEVSGERTVVLADRARVRTMIGAMVESARWWGEEGPVKVEVEPGPTPCVRVSRARTSLNPGTAQGLFRPRSPSSGQGSKVGLFVAEGLARAHGGTLVAEAGDSIAFTLRLPAGHT